MGVTQSSPAGTELRLPTELYKSIADNLGSNDRCAHALSLMSEFHELATSVMYRNITIDLSDMQGDILAAKLASTLEAKPELALHIRHLTLRRGARDICYRDMISRSPTATPESRGVDNVQYYEYLRRTTPYITEKKILPIILGSAKRLFMFKLDYYLNNDRGLPWTYWSGFAPELQGALTSVLQSPTVRHKTINAVFGLPTGLVDALHAEQVVLFLIGLATPESLSTDRSDIASTGGIAERVRGGSTERLSLVFDDLSIPATVTYCTSPSFLAHRTLHCFAYNSHGSAGFQRLQAALDRLAPILTRFALSFQPCIATHSPDTEKLDLSRLRLQRMSLFFATDDLNDHGAKLALETLESLGSKSNSGSGRCLKAICLQVLWMNPALNDEDRDGGHWAGWNKVLGDLAANGVEEIQFESIGYKDAPGMGPDLKHYLPSVGNKLVPVYK
ncbi:hypothetical protein FA15DRAFT_654070 [Coprinopsis marcescibilis]|uniref:F-box domain-containing protein n=1 Tax=Coprinopsis marcescibilis TaxID=230819 RepID=A0A5C3L2Y0_COPMA|nr:hypothetical protein FA15DRAFT_654070 [Coprinopsis marcescibilis]